MNINMHPMTGWNRMFRNIVQVFTTRMLFYPHTIMSRMMFVINYICIVAMGINVMAVSSVIQLMQCVNIYPLHHDPHEPTRISHRSRGSHGSRGSRGFHGSRGSCATRILMAKAMEVVTKGMTFLINLLPIRIAITGDALQDNNFVIIVNHQSNNDSILVHYWAAMYNKSKHIRVLYKSSLATIPVFGYIMRNMNYIPVSRAWKNDKDVLDHLIREFDQYQRILIYPEGTRFSEKKKLASIKYALENNLPIMNNTLVPRVKGFNLILEKTRWTHENPITVPVYDVTLVYHPWCIHIHAKRYHRKEYGSAWLIDRFKDKTRFFSQSPPTPTNVFCYYYIEHFCLLVLLLYTMYHYIGNVHYQCLLGASTLFFWVVDCFGLY